jgi:ribosome biogenesis GTPase
LSNREAKRWRHYEAAKVTGQIRKQIKPNRKPKTRERRDWASEDLNEGGSPQSERIMPLGERERRRANLTAALAKIEEEASAATEPSPGAEMLGRRGIVVEVGSNLCRVDLDGQSLICGLRGSLSVQETGFTNVVAVGDEVVVAQDGAERGIVEAVLPRRSVLARPDVFYPHLQQVIVANADQLLIVASWREPAIWLELIDRYLITAERYRLSLLICVNKTDLAEDVAVCRQTMQPYLDLDYRVIFTSALTGDGIGELRQALRGQTTVLAGLSGVGKSSLLMAVQPGLQLRTGAVSQVHHEGRHVTSQVHLLKLAMGGFVVDTPGIREFGLSGLRRGELASFYPEIVAAARECRFSNCVHIREAGCAVPIAVQQGQVAATRYHSYQKIYQTLPA